MPDDIRRYVPVEFTAKGLPVIQWERIKQRRLGLVKIDLGQPVALPSFAMRSTPLPAIPVARSVCELGSASRSCDAGPDPARRHDRLLLYRIAGDPPPAQKIMERHAAGPARRGGRIRISRHGVVARAAGGHHLRARLRPAGPWPSHKPLHPLMDNMLQETHGIMVYQEDVTKVGYGARRLSLEDADQLRKVISKKHKSRQLRDYYHQFCRGAAKNRRRLTPSTNLDDDRELRRLQFRKPHSASYAQVSFKSAYLRAHYPAEFIASVISNQGGFYSAFAYVSEARRMGLAILPPDVNASDWAYRGEGDRLRIGLMQVKTLQKELGDVS